MLLSWIKILLVVLAMSSPGRLTDSNHHENGPGSGSRVKRNEEGGQ